MLIPDLVLRKSLNTRGLQKLMWTRLRWLIVRHFGDPACTFAVHGRNLKLPLSHELPTYLNLFPLYDTLPGRLASFLRDRYGPLRIVDVGANIGDTISAAYGGEADRFLAVEPNPKFNRYLHDNWPGTSVTILDDVCSDRTGRQSFVIDERYGTASFRQSPQGRELATVTLDDLVLAHPEFAGPHLIKVDTDGNDFAVLVGASRSIVYEPAVLFESDVFGNPRYVEDCLGALETFRQAGYESLLVYEKFGHPLGRHQLGDLAHFKDLLLHQLVKGFTFYDILLMKEPDLALFHQREQAFFLESLPDQRLRLSAAKAL